MHDNRTVSVPWRGLGSFGLATGARETEAAWLVSVPWRGLGSFGQGACMISNPRIISFRPLAGIRVFRTGFENGWLTGTGEVSVPWRGLGSFGLVTLKVRADKAGYKFPSPGGD